MALAMRWAGERMRSSARLHRSLSFYIGAYICTTSSYLVIRCHGSGYVVPRLPFTSLPSCNHILLVTKADARFYLQRVTQGRRSRKSISREGACCPLAAAGKKTALTTHAAEHSVSAQQGYLPRYLPT